MTTINLISWRVGGLGVGVGHGFSKWGGVLGICSHEISIFICNNTYDFTMSVSHIFFTYYSNVVKLYLWSPPATTKEAAMHPECCSPGCSPHKKV